jgi:DNA-directed RNA polymerase specialized sigma24 family protein
MGKRLPESSRWVLTQETFDLLLARLHANREQAGQQYETLRKKLCLFFEARHCVQPEWLVDETLNRLARKVSAGEEVQHLDAYALTIARFVWLEAQRAETAVSLESLLLEETIEDADQRAQEFAAREREAERLHAMQRCLFALPKEARELLTEYYQGTAEDRKTMAERLGLSENALYLKIHRLRQKLERNLQNTG